jgi:hypothetical protein
LVQLSVLWSVEWPEVPLVPSLVLKLVPRLVQKLKLFFRPATLEALALMSNLNAQLAVSKVPQVLLQAHPLKP